MRKNKNRVFKKEVAYMNNTISLETSLPYPIVYYPGHYGSFMGFKEDHNSEMMLCSCSKEAIKNFIKLKEFYDTGPYSSPERNFILDSMYFPIELVVNLINLNLPNDLDVFNYLVFKDNLCHECNKVIPLYSYCLPMYGTKFVQTYGWYINKQYYEYGIQPISFNYLENVHEDIKEVISLDPHTTNMKISELYVQERYEASKELRKMLDEQKKKIHKVIENSVRIKFGHKKIGEGWTNETLLYYTIKEIFPEKTILRHYRPDFLEGMELDIFIANNNIGIEYQGIQHFESVKHWGGQAALEKNQERDKRKFILCKNNSVNLVYFYHYEDITNDLVKSKLFSLVLDI